MKDQLIRLGSKRPDLQCHIKPVLDTITASSNKKSLILYDHALNWVREHNRKVANKLDGTWINEREATANLSGSQIEIQWDRMTIAGDDVNPKDLSDIEVIYTDGQRHVETKDYVELGQDEMALEVATRLRSIAEKQLPSPRGGRR